MVLEVSLLFTQRWLWFRNCKFCDPTNSKGRWIQQRHCPQLDAASAKVSAGNTIQRPAKYSELTLNVFKNSAHFLKATRQDCATERMMKSVFGPFQNSRFASRVAQSVLCDQALGRQPRNRVSIPVREIDFSFLLIVHTGPGIHPSSYSVGIQGFFPGGKAAGA